MDSSRADAPLHVATVRAIDAGLSDPERVRFIGWARALLALRNADLSAAQKAREALRLTRQAAVVPPAVKALWKPVSEAAWKDRSWAARGALGGIAIAVATNPGKGAGIAALGTAVGVPLWVVFGAGGAFAGTLADELEGTLHRGPARRASTVPLGAPAFGEIEDADWELIENAVVPAVAGEAPAEPDAPGETDSLWGVFRRAYRGARVRQRLSTEASGEAALGSIEAAPARRSRIGPARIFVPTESPESWKAGLSAEGQWKEGFSAMALAEAWERAPGFPPAVERLLATSPVLASAELLLALPEHRVALPGGNQATRTDLWVLARAATGLASIALEGKVKESLGPTLGGWSRDASSGKQQRLAYLRDLLGLPEVLPDDLRYQLLHRTAAAVLEARRFLAPHAAMVVHSFSAGNEGVEDFRAFARLLGAEVEPGRLVQVPGRTAPTLHLGWAADVSG